MADDLTAPAQLVEDILGRLQTLDSQTRLDLRAWFAAHTKKAFDSEGAYSGSRWADYSREPRYRAYKRAVTGGDNLLRYPGVDALKRSVTRAGDRDQVFRVNGQEFIFGSKLPFARDVLRGGVGPFGERYPGRDYLGLGSRGLRSLAAKLATYYTNGPLGGSEWRNV